MLKNIKLIFLLIAIVFLINNISAGITITPDKINPGEVVQIMIDEKEYSTFLYLLDSSDVIQTLDLGCIGNCKGTKTFSYPFNLPLGTYFLFLYSVSSSWWISASFEIVSTLPPYLPISPQPLTKCYDNTPLTNCSSSTGKPYYCDKSGNIISKCSLCGCPNNMACQTDESCKFICSDGTSDDYCSLTKPNYCDNGILIPKCFQCKCSTGQTCQLDNTCAVISCSLFTYSAWNTCSNGQQTRTILSSSPSGCDGGSPELIKTCVGNSCQENSQCSSGICQDGKCAIYVPSVGTNKKSMSLYLNKEIFLISDKDWKEVLPLVPVTTWTEGNEIKKYPMLVYHQEDFAFDADSSIYFMQQYLPSKLTLVGNSPQELDNLLIASPDFGAGFSQENIKRISSNDYLTYWESFDTLVYVQDDYELSLLASTYASLINAPLIIKGTSEDNSNVFSGRNVICIGNVAPSESNCKEQYNLEQLRDKYKSITNTDKIILVNPNDYFSPNVIRFNPDKSSDYILNLYYKTSLIAPILASAKHELILSTKETDYITIDSFLKPKLSGMNYLTIMASSYVIPDKLEGSDPEAIGFLGSFLRMGFALDPYYYADTTGDNKPDVSVGRIAGISSSDVSSYIARDLFSNSISKTNNVKLMASSFSGLLKTIADNMVYYFQNSGFNTIASTHIEEGYRFNPTDWENQDLIYYADHGAAYWAGILSWDISELTNSLVVLAACDTVSTSDSFSFWAHTIRKGALGIYGAVTISAFNTNGLDFLNNVYYDNLSIGESFKNSYTPSLFQRMNTLIGDPTLNMAPTHLIRQKISLSKTIFCQQHERLCGIWPMESLGIGCCAGQKCSLFTCQDCFITGTNLHWPYLLGDDPSRCCNGVQWITRQDTNFCCYNKRNGDDPKLCCYNKRNGDDPKLCCWGKWYEPWKCGWSANHCGTTPHYDWGCWWNADYCGTTSVNDHKQCT